MAGLWKPAVNFCYRFRQLSDSVLHSRYDFICNRNVFRHCSQLAKSSTQSIPHKEFSTIEREELFQKSLQHQDYFEVGNLFTISDLFKARVHLGHKKGLRNEYMIPYVYGNRLDTDIIDLDQTAENLRIALNVMAHIAYRQGILLFLCRNRQHAIAVENAAAECGEYAHCRYWRGGLFTNSTLQYRSATRLPDACIFINTQNNVFGIHKAVYEAAKTQIITIGIVDTNCDPRLITYPIPGNDDTPSAIKLYCKLFKEAVTLGKKRFKKDCQELLIKDSSQ